MLICIAKEVHLDTITSWFRRLVNFKFTFPVISYKSFVNANSARWHIQKVSSFLQVLYQESNRYVLLIEWNGAFSTGIFSMSPGPVIKSENIINPESINSYIFIYIYIYIHVFVNNIVYIKLTPQHTPSSLTTLFIYKYIYILIMRSHYYVKQGKALLLYDVVPDEGIYGDEFRP